MGSPVYLGDQRDSSVGSAVVQQRRLPSPPHPGVAAPVGHVDNEMLMHDYSPQPAGPGQFGGRSVQHRKSQTLPEISTDYLLSYVVLHFGWVPAVLLIALLAAFLIYLFRLSVRQTNALAFWYRWPAASLLTSFEILLYLTVNLGIFYMALPFFSYGELVDGTKLVYCRAAAVGSLTRTILPAGRLPQSSMGHRFFTFENGKMTIDFNR